MSIFLESGLLTEAFLISERLTFSYGRLYVLFGCAIKKKYFPSAEKEGSPPFTLKEFTDFPRLINGLQLSLSSLKET